MDNARLPLRSRRGRTMKMCHMVADTLEELHDMADKVGMKREWFQTSGRYPHYDLSLSRRKIAVSLGAKETNSRTIIQKAKRLREEYLALNDPSLPALK